MMGNIVKFLNGETPRSTATNADVDAINAECFELNKDRTLDDVLAEFNSNLPKVEASIAPLTDTDINDAQRFPQRDGSPLLYHIIGNTFGHYSDHDADLKRFVESLQAP
jgi:hypothetical protein